VIVDRPPPAHGATTVETVEAARSWLNTLT
jgi:hypothetical protein